MAGSCLKKLVTHRDGESLLRFLICATSPFKSKKLVQLENEDLNRILLQIHKDHRHLISIVYDAVKTIPEFQRIVNSEKNVRMFQNLRLTELVGITRSGEGIRMDFPGDVKFKAPWHQDYLSQFGSYDGLVFWSPLVPISKEIGPLQVLEKSHAAGLLPVFYEDEKHSNTPYGLKIYNEEQIIRKYNCKELVCDPGDLLILDFKTIHRSGNNSSAQVRWSMQMRYFNFNDPLGISKGWSGGFASGANISTVHPELLITS